VKKHAQGLTRKHRIRIQVILVESLKLHLLCHCATYMRFCIQASTIWMSTSASVAIWAMCLKPSM